MLQNQLSIMQSWVHCTAFNLTNQLDLRGVVLETLSPYKLDGNFNLGSGFKCKNQKRVRVWSFEINVCNQATAHLPPPLHNSQFKKTSYRVNVSLGEGKVCRRCLVTDIYLRFHYWWAFHFQSVTCGSWDLFFRQNSNEYKVLIRWILLSPEW